MLKHDLLDCAEHLSELRKTDRPEIRSLREPFDEADALAWLEQVADRSRHHTADSHESVGSRTAAFSPAWLQKNGNWNSGLIPSARGGVT